jgi:hypothetical protein
MRSLPPRSSLYCAAFAILALSSLGLLWRGPTNSAGSAASAVAEYRKEARALELAPGWRWPAEPPIDPDSGYGKGYGAELADSYWFCSWGRRALSPRISARARRQALEQLPKMRETTFYTLSLPETRTSLDATIERALLGNTSMLRGYVSDCPSRGRPAR